MFRRINFFSGPGAGKSTIASRVFSDLKIEGYDVEHISEYIKLWAHEGRKPKSFDQLYVFAQQLHLEDVTLQHVEHIVTDSPILLNTAYAKLYGFSGYEHMIRLSGLFDVQFPPINFFIERSVPYKNAGRYQSYEEALAFDKMLIEHLDEHLQSELIMVRVDQFDKIVGIIKSMINHP